MAQSLSPECTPLKKEYDSCFNAWFEGYLEPAVSALERQREAYSKSKAEEFQQKCGKVWEAYRGCVQVLDTSMLPVVFQDLFPPLERGEGEGTRPATSASKGGESFSRASSPEHNPSIEINRALCIIIIIYSWYGFVPPSH